MNLLRTAFKIIPILTENLESRDCDLILITETWKKELGDISTMSALDLINSIVSKLVEHPESIRRTRQKIQQKNEKFRGQKYESRHGMESSICDQLTFFDKWGI